MANFFNPFMKGPDMGQGAQGIMQQIMQMMMMKKMFPGGGGEGGGGGLSAQGPMMSGQMPQGMTSGIGGGSPNYGGMPQAGPQMGGGDGAVVPGIDPQMLSQLLPFLMQMLGKSGGGGGLGGM